MVNIVGMFDHCVIRGRHFYPARFSAPLAGYTHSAFRRLLAELGGCGAVWTEMLAARQLLREDFRTSPWLRRHPVERNVIFQLMVRAGDPLEAILARLADQGVDAVDLNLACNAFSIRACEAGSALFEDFEALSSVIQEARRHWSGLLTAKVRLGSRRPDWQSRFALRLRLLEDSGIDAVTLHPRFFEDKFRRRAQHELLGWVASLTRLPLIANGDFASREQVEAQASSLRPACAVMIGRMAVAQPWLFAHWDSAATPDFAEVWHRMRQYLTEDFPPLTALRRLQSFTRYFSANFAFGHAFRVSIANASSLDAAQELASDFFARGPATVSRPMVAGL
ncbi:MAG: tRNA-dihydrouridine synthase [Limisphaerales bacterium]